jgi:hypothetical protein
MFEKVYDDQISGKNKQGIAEKRETSHQVHP